ncbi:MAG: HipA family kinase [Caldilineaceae bacterium]
MKQPSIRTVFATRYVTPLREGGSLPAVVEADDGALYAMKFVGAGQGAKALIAELIAGEIGRALGLRVPELVLIDMDETLGRSEGDPEIQDLLKASIGLNLGLRYLPNAFDFNVLLAPPPDPVLASEIVWFDAYVTNVDRTARNVNMLMWQDDLWLIDHGASLYFHHSWEGYRDRVDGPFPMIRQHTLLKLAGHLEEADRRLRPQISDELLRCIVDLIPEQWLGGETIFEDVAAHRQGYVEYLSLRRDAADTFLQEAARARAAL